MCKETTRMMILLLSPTPSPLLLDVGTVGQWGSKTKEAARQMRLWRCLGCFSLTLSLYGHLGKGSVTSWMEVFGSCCKKDVPRRCVLHYLFINLLLLPTFPNWSIAQDDLQKLELPPRSLEHAGPRPAP